MKPKKLILILIPLLLLTSLGGYYLYNKYFLPVYQEEVAAAANTPVPITVSTPTPVPTKTPEPTPTPFPEYDITLMALGDDLLHMGIVNTGKQADGSYDFSFLFSQLGDVLAQTDIKVINQETVFAGNQLGFSGYPRFNSPTEVGDAIAAAGFNVVLHATNHSGDQKLPGIKACAAFWDKYPEILMVGMRDEPSEEPEIPLLTIEGVTFAILNYTYGANSSTLPLSYEGYLNVLCDYNRKTGAMDFTSLNPTVLEDIQKADELADIVIVFPHWGNEYQTKPSTYQQEFARQMTEAGADLLIGAHPHVVQPVEWITAGNGNKALCFYSLGNYASTQKDPISMFEAMAYVTFHVTETDVYIKEENTGAVPLVCHYTANPVRYEATYFVDDYTPKQADAHGIRIYGQKVLHFENLQKWTEEILGDFALSKSQILP